MAKADVSGMMTLHGLHLRQVQVMSSVGKEAIIRLKCVPACRVYKEAEELHKDYESGVVHPSDLKPALSQALNAILQPVRDHFDSNAEAKELLKKVKSYKITK